MKKRNIDIRNYAKEKEICLWQIADALGISDMDFSKMMRYEIAEQKKTEIREIINRLATEEEA